jgi:hypothetical protein
MDTGGNTRRGRTGETRRTPRLKDFITNPQTVANELGAQEERDIISSGGITRNLREDEKRFAKKSGSAFFTGQDVGDDYFTKPWEDTRTDAQKDKDDRADARATKEREKAASAVETVEGEEETTTPATPVETAQQTVQDLADTTVSAEAAGRTRSVAETEAASDKARGYKSNTSATSPSGISSEDKEDLRPKRSAMRKGLLTDEDDPKKKKTLIA